MTEEEGVPSLLAEAERRAQSHFDDVERAIAGARLGELLRDLPPIEEQIRQAKKDIDYAP